MRPERQPKGRKIHRLGYRSLSYSVSSLAKAERAGRAPRAPVLAKGQAAVKALGPAKGRRVPKGPMGVSQQRVQKVVRTVCNLY